MSAVCDVNHRWMINTKDDPTRWTFRSVRELLELHDGDDERHWTDRGHQTHSLPLIAANPNSDFLFDNCLFLEAKARNDAAFLRDFIRFIGFMLARGQATEQTDSHGHSSWFLRSLHAGSDPRSLGWLNALTVRLAVHWPLFARAKVFSAGDGQYSLIVECGRRVHDWIRPMLEERERCQQRRTFYCDWIFRLSRLQSHCLIEGIVVGCGDWNTLESAKGEADTIQTNSVRAVIGSRALLHNLSVVAVMAEAQAEYEVVNGDGDTNATLRWLMTVKFDASAMTSPLPRPHRRKNAGDDGFIYCLSAPLCGNFLARRHPTWDKSGRRVLNAYSQAFFTGNCQMGKQTMGTPFHSFAYRTDNKVFRIQNPQSPIVRNDNYVRFGIDEYPLGTNAVVAVLAYTGYDMEDAMIINKCWGAGTLILMFDGTQRAVEDIAVGDLLMGDDSTPRRVLCRTVGNTSDDAARHVVKQGHADTGRPALYRVDSARSGRWSFTCNNKHILVVRIDSVQPSKVALRIDDDRISFVYSVPTVEYGTLINKAHTFTTAAEAETARAAAVRACRPLRWECTVDEWLACAAEIRQQCRMLRPRRVHFPPPENSLRDRLESIVGRPPTDALVLESAWILGIWLTHGRSRRAEIVERVNNAPVIRKLKRCFFYRSGAAASARRANTIFVVHLNVVFHRLLQTYALIGRKHIPFDLLRESCHVRLMLLAGMIDGDGQFHSDRRVYHFAARKRHLIDGVVHLFRGLGYATDNLVRAKYVKQIGDQCAGWHVVASSRDMHMIQTEAPYKRASRGAHNDDSLGDRFSVTKMSDGAYYGLTLDGNRRCLLANFIVTHNCAAERGLKHGSVYKYKAISLTEKTARGETVHRRFSNVDALTSERVSHSLDADGLPHIGARLRKDDPFYAVIDDVTRRVTVTGMKESEDCVVEDIRVFAEPSDATANNATPTSAVGIKLRFNRNPVVGDKFASRAGQKGVMSTLFPTESMPFTESGMTPDIIINPHAFPSRMTIGMLIESMAGKAGAMHGTKQNSTPFQFSESDRAIDYFGKQLVAAGYNYVGSEPMYSGITGEELRADIFIGVVYYQRLRHMVSDKAQVRSTGPVNAVTRQPVKGRKVHGGIRFGEMERDSLLGHGTAYLLHDRLMNSSDYHTTVVCTQCGSLLTPQLTHGGNEHTNGSERAMRTCRQCQTDRFCQIIAIPFVFLYLANELATMNIKLTLKVA